MHSPEQTRGPLERAVFDALAEGIVWQDASGRVVDANAAAATILGLTREELLGRTPRDPRWYAVREDGSPWPGDEHPAMLALRTGTPQRGQVMGIVVPDVGRRWISIHSMPLAGSAFDGLEGVVTSFADVTERIDLWRRLEVAHRDLNELYDHAPVGYHVLDARGLFARINQTELDWLGCTPEEVIGKLGPRDFLTVASRRVFEADFPRLLAGESLSGVEVDLVGRDGRCRRVLLNAVPVVGMDGRTVGTRSVLDDITELHSSRQLLQRMASQQARMLDNELVGIVRLRGRTIVWKNRAFDRILGYGPDELIGSDTRVLYPDEVSYERVGDGAYAVLRAGGVFRLQQELRHKDGGSVWLDCSGFMLDPDTDEVVWFSMDVTAQRRAEELRVQAARLEAENSQLVEMNRLQRAFLANMSHELRTPLNAVIGFAQLLKAGVASPGTDKHDAYLGNIETAGRHLLSMVESVLEAAAGESGKLTFRAEQIDLAAVLHEVVDLLEPKSRARKVRVSTTLAEDLPTVRLDPLRFRQVLLNYIGNAIKFSREGGRVDVRLSRASAGRFRVDVEDRGVGIAAREIPKLFTSFQQASTAGVRAFDGLGVGLSVVKMTVEAQGGEVGLHSEPGVGSIFWAELPVDFPAY